MIGRRMGTGGPGTPLITRDDIPDMPPLLVDPSSVFNPGAVKIGGAAVLLLRVQSRGRRSFLVPAVYDGDLEVVVAKRPSELRGLDRLPLDVHHVYDPRLTMLDGGLHVVTALDTDQGGRLAVWRAAGKAGGPFAGLETLDLVGLTGDYDTRNGVLFPERVGGRILMLERPNRPTRPGSPPSGSTISLIASNDLVTWEPAGDVMSGRDHFWDELIGAGPPPVLTKRGWLLVYHGVATHFASANIYQGGCVLLDRDDPTRVIARGGDNILEPREPWEMMGQVPNVTFPSGMTVSSSGTVRIFYGAADTCVGMLETTVDDLLAACDAP